MPAINKNPNRATPSLPQPGDTSASQNTFMSLIKEAIEVHERRIGRVEDSFLRVQDLIDLGVLTATAEGDQITLALTRQSVLKVRWSDSAALVAASQPVRLAFVPHNATIVAVAVTTLGGAGSCVIDLWKTDIANSPPTVVNTITASAKPTITAGTSYYDTGLSGWTTALAEKDVVAFKIDSTSTFTDIIVSLVIEETQ